MLGICVAVPADGVQLFVGLSANCGVPVFVLIGTEIRGIGRGGDHTLLHSRDLKGTQVSYSRGKITV
uniref:Uncharacterized protein n=1 Tax=Anguilla anguilla TaxID=7936 RepID=A0A0E9QGS9_ANGAN